MFSVPLPDGLHFIFYPLTSIKWANSKTKHLSIHVYTDIF